MTTQEQEGLLWGATLCGVLLARALKMMTQAVILWGAATGGIAIVRAIMSCACRTFLTCPGTGTIPRATPKPAPAPSAAEIDFPAVGPADVAVFWDFENVRIPAWCPATTAAEAIRGKVAKYGRIVEKRLYYDSRQPAELAAPRLDLDLSGFTLVDCPNRSKKETLDKKLIVDVLCFAWERSSVGSTACVVLITSDGDYSYALARLRDMGAFTVVIYRPDIVAKVLIDNANVVMSWEFDVLGGPPVLQGEEDCEGDGSTHGSTMLGATDSIGDGTELTPAHQEEINRPDSHTQGKFALFCSVALNAQHRNVREGISVYSSWAPEAGFAAMFYDKIGEKDRDGYLELRTLATEKGFIEWGRRNLLAPGKPVIKVKTRDERAEDLSMESYLRLTYAGVSIVNPDIVAKENDWAMVWPRPDKSSPLMAPPQGVPPSVDPANAMVPNGKLFVGGLAWATTEDSLRSYFCQYGALRHVLVKEGKGFGFVFFRCPNDAEEVLKDAGHHVVDNNSVDVKPYVQNKDMQ